MESVFYILAKLVAIYLDLVSFSMLGRVILQFFVNPEESKLYALTVFISEPFIMPFRMIFNKFNIGENSPLDMPFLVAALSLSFVSLILPPI